MTKCEADLIAASVHLLHAICAADLATGILFNDLGGQTCKDLVWRINKAVGDIDRVRGDIVKLLTNGEGNDRRTQKGEGINA